MNTEREQKQRMVDEAINSVALEGFEVSEQQRKMFASYVNGDISLGDLNLITKKGK